MILLGITYKNIETLYEEKRLNELPIMLETLSDMFDSGAFEEEMKNIPVDRKIQMELTKEIIDLKLRDGINSKRYIENLKNILIGIGYENEEDSELNLENIFQSYEKYFQIYKDVYLKKNEYIFENYLVNEYFKEKMPFGDYKNIWDSYISISVMYSLLRFHTVGLLAYHKEINEDLLVDMMQTFSRVFIHNNKYIQNMIKLLKDSGYYSEVQMAMLLKN